MLIPENGKWRWNDGPLCDTKDEAVASAKDVAIKDSGAQVYVVDGMHETMRIRDDDEATE